MPTDRPQPRPRGQEARSPEACASDIGWIIQHAADRRGMPKCRSLSGLAAHLLQAPAYCAQAHSIQADPREHEPNEVRLRFHQFETCHSAALDPTHVAISEGSPGQRTHGSGLRGMAPPAPARAPGFWPARIRRSRLEPGAKDHPPLCRRSGGSGKQPPRPRGETRRSRELDGRTGVRAGPEHGHRCGRYGRWQPHPAAAPAPDELELHRCSLHPHSCGPVRAGSPRQRYAHVVR
jgi:hypothetical protein